MISLPEHEGEPTACGNSPMFELLDLFNDFTVVFDPDEGQVIRTSEKFKQRFFNADEFTLYDFFNQFSGVDKQPLNFIHSDNFSHEGQIFVFYGDQEKPYSFSVAHLKSGLVLIYLDKNISQKDEVQRYLKDREQLFSTSRIISVSEMATTLAHEINQPIGTIANLLQGMRMRMERLENPQEGFLSAIDKMIDQTSFAANIISRIRDFTHSKRPENEAIALIPLLDASVSLLDWEISKNQIVLDVKCSDDIRKLQIIGDRTMLQQVFVNLLRNSIEAIRDNDSSQKLILITVFLSNNNVEFQFSDTGCGLTSESKDNLFLPFISSKSTGMGVGLNICRSFIELHQGKLWLSSNAENPLNRSGYNVGCTAHVVLPLINIESNPGSYSTVI